MNLKKQLFAILITILFLGAFLNIIAADQEEGKKQMKILPLGDSITYGTTRETGKPEFHGGYRYFLEKMLINTYGAKSFCFIGIYDTGSPNMTYPKHSGKRGIAIDEITHAKGGIAASLKKSGTPDIILLMAGTNDLGRQKEKPEKAIKEMKELLQALHKNVPAAQILIAKIPPTRSKGRNKKTKQFNQLLEPLVKERSTQGQLIHLVDIFSAIDNTKEGLPDGTHPNQKNYEKMAKPWFEAIQKLNLLKKID